MDVLESDPKMDARGAGANQADYANPMAAMIDQYLELPTPQRGDIVEGVVVSVSPTEILVDIGGKTEGVITGRELERMDPACRADYQVGDEVVAYVVRPEGWDGHVVLSLVRAQQEKDWRIAEKKMRSGEVVRTTVVDANRGGLIVNVGRLRGFVPASQLRRDRRDPRRPSQDGEDDSPWADAIGREIDLKVLEVDRRRNRLILSERAVERVRQQGQRDQLFAELQEGACCQGVVRSLCDFGAFIDLGGADGLVHLSELSWRRVQHPAEVLQLGDEVEVYVLNVDRERQRIALSMRRLQPEPWTQAAEQYQAGQIVEATVTRITEFGAFASITDELEGLIHISELASYHVEHPRQVLKEGQVVRVCILRIEPERHRLGLSLKQAAEADLEVDWEVGDSEEDADWEADDDGADWDAEGQEENERLAEEQEE